MALWVGEEVWYLLGLVGEVDGRVLVAAAGLVARVVQDLHHRLQPAQVGDRAPDRRVPRDLPQDLQRADLQDKIP